MRINKFLDDYLYYTKNTETPELMHLWCGVSALCGAAERRVWLDRGMFNLYLNLYIVLVGPPGLVAKTTSLGFSTKILHEAGFNVADMVATKEKIIVEMADAGTHFIMPSGASFPHTSITFSMSELNTLLTAGMDMVLFLTNIWDKNDLYVYKTKTSGEFEIVNPYFNMIGAATTEWFKKAVDTDMLSSGFLARCILVYADQKRGKFSKPVLTADQKEARKRCLAILDEISHVYGEIVMSDEAEEAYDKWYTNLPDSTTADSRIAGYLERKAKTFILKLAAIIAIGDLRMEVKKSDFIAAKRIFNMTEPALKQCLMLLGTNKVAEYIRLVLLSLINDKHHKVDQVDIFRQFYHVLTTDDVVEIFKSLRSMNLVKFNGTEISLVSVEQAKIFLNKDRNPEF